MCFIPHAMIAGAKTASELPLILVHGLFGNMRNLGLVARHAVSLGFEVHSVDVRNHGNVNPHLPEMDFRVMADDLLRYLDARSISDCVLLGFSLGGKISMATALTQPDRVAGLIVGDIAPVKYSQRNWDIPDVLKAIQQIDLSRQPGRLEVDAELAKTVHEKDVRSFIMTNYLTDPSRWRMNVDAIAANLDAIADFPFSSETHKFPKPALFIRGSRSRLLSEKYFEQVKAFFPRASIESLDAGHWVHNERPQQFHDLVSNYLQQFMK
jgi:pimeloyl-ACP methyl ester carboxylesterase